MSQDTSIKQVYKIIVFTGNDMGPMNELNNLKDNFN